MYAVDFYLRARVATSCLRLNARTYACGLLVYVMPYPRARAAIYSLAMTKAKARGIAHALVYENDRLPISVFTIIITLVGCPHAKIKFR